MNKKEIQKIQLKKKTLKKMNTLYDIILFYLF